MGKIEQFLKKIKKVADLEEGPGARDNVNQSNNDYYNRNNLELEQQQIQIRVQSPLTTSGAKIRSQSSPPPGDAAAPPPDGDAAAPGSKQSGRKKGSLEIAKEELLATMKDPMRHLRTQSPKSAGPGPESFSSGYSSSDSGTSASSSSSSSQNLSGTNNQLNQQQIQQQIFSGSGTGTNTNSSINNNSSSNTRPGMIMKEEYRAAAAQASSSSSHSSSSTGRYLQGQSNTYASQSYAGSLHNRLNQLMNRPTETTDDVETGTGRRVDGDKFGPILTPSAAHDSAPSAAQDAHDSATIAAKKGLRGLREPTTLPLLQRAAEEQGKTGKNGIKEGGVPLLFLTPREQNEKAQQGDSKVISD